MIFLISIFLLELISLYFLFYRNLKVFKFRGKLEAKIFSIVDKREYFNPDWRIDTFNQVPYWKMVFTFWKPLKPKSFWKDLSFLKEEK